MKRTMSEVMQAHFRNAASQSVLENVADIRDVSMVFGKRSRITALESVKFTLQRNEVVALRGPSGCGKSTTLWLLADLLVPAAGDVQVEFQERQSSGVASR